MESLPENQEQEQQQVQEPRNLVERVNSIELIRSLEGLDQGAATETLEAAFKAKLVSWYFKGLKDTFKYAVVIKGDWNEPPYRALAIVEQTTVGRNSTTYDHLDKIVTHPDHQRNGHFLALIEEIRKQSPQGYFLRAKESNWHRYNSTGHQDLSGGKLVSVYSPHFGSQFDYNIFGWKIPAQDAFLVMHYLLNIPPTINKPA